MGGVIATWDGQPNLMAYDGFAQPGQTALWDWDLSGPTPVVSGYAGQPTKTGLLPNDLQQFVGVPIIYYAPAGAGSGPVPNSTLLEWIRDAEDWVEQETGLLLTPTWVASPPAITRAQAVAADVPALDGQGQVQGIDYDLADAAYDFIYQRSQDEGWTITPLRYRPIRNVTQSATDFTAVKQYSFIYPLLAEYFRVPPTWFVEDQDFGLVRLVPAQNVAMLPLFALQLAMLGYAQTIPGGCWLQYTAGLTAIDYGSRFRFIKQLVLCQAAITALSSIQGTINMGVSQQSTLIDGLQFQLRYNDKGPFAGQIDNFQKRRDELLSTALSKVFGPSFISF